MRQVHLCISLPQNNAAILSTAASVLPCPRCQRRIDGSTALNGREPGVDDETGAGVELMGLRGEVDVVDGIEESRGRDLGGLRTSTLRSTEWLRGHREHGHAARHDGEMRGRAVMPPMGLSPAPGNVCRRSGLSRVM
jgi:hypothetical protein